MAKIVSVTECCGKCGCAFPVNPPGHTGGTGRARFGALTVCYPCANDAERIEMSRADKYGCYVSGTGWNLTTWAGGHLARITSTREKRNPFGGTLLSVWAIMQNGTRWYGVGAGRGMCITMRRLKAR